MFFRNLAGWLALEGSSILSSILRFFNPVFKRQWKPVQGGWVRIRLAPMLCLLLILPGVNFPVTAKTGLVNGSVYYISPLGSDSNPGSLARPWKTLGHAAAEVSAGDTVYLRSGTYQEAVYLYHPGTAGQRITFAAYPGETPAIDGKGNTIPGDDWYPLVKIEASYVTWSGIEVRYSRGMGIALTGQYNLVERANVHHHMENGILLMGDHNEVRNNRVWSNCLMNVNGGSSQGWSAGVSAARSPSGSVIRGNIVAENWGEGISTFETEDALIEGNTVYDNWSANIYVSNAQNILVQKNFVYATGDMPTSGGGTQVGIMLGDETTTPVSMNIQIINNIVYHTDHNLWWWKCDSYNAGMINVVIANNSLINASQGAGITIAQGNHSNVIIQNNIIQQEGPLPVALIIANPELDFAHNLWSKAPPAAAAGRGDILGSPGFERLGSPYAPSWYSLAQGSAAIGRALALNDVTEDYFGDARDGQPDIGADEASPLNFFQRIYLPAILRFNLP